LFRVDFRRIIFGPSFGRFVVRLRSAVGRALSSDRVTLSSVICCSLAAIWTAGIAIANNGFRVDWVAVFSSSVSIVGAYLAGLGRSPRDR
jgi:hypothetical protein